MRTAVFLVGSLLLLSGCSADPAEPASAPTVEPTTPVSSPSVVSAEPSEEAEPVTEPTMLLPLEPVENTSTLPPVEQPEPQGGPWTKLDLTIRSGADAIKQDALPQSFKDFLVSRIGVEDEVGCSTKEVVLHGIHPDGFVYGLEESSCGGTQTVWGIADNQWNYIVAFLDAPPCADLAYNKIPAGAPGLRCTGDDGSAQDY
ncbi:MAG: hypothetical protein Q4G35_06655 [Propionibacteriaceae bacterium]|nr:hypothetical protein [Propionibacteriaceae bacterium]